MCGDHVEGVFSTLETAQTYVKVHNISLCYIEGHAVDALTDYVGEPANDN
jgi:hypothetical protein